MAAAAMAVRVTAAGAWPFYPVPSLASAATAAAVMGVGVTAAAEATVKAVPATAGTMAVRGLGAGA